MLQFDWLVREISSLNLREEMLLRCSCRNPNSLKSPQSHTKMNETKWNSSKLGKRLTELYLKVSYGFIIPTLKVKWATFSQSNRPFRANRGGPVDSMRPFLDCPGIGILTRIYMIDWEKIKTYIYFFGFEIYLVTRTGC